MKLWIVFCDGS
jgi:ribonuclease HI